MNTVYFEGTKQVLQTMNLKDGKRDGLFTEYYKNGKTRSRAWYVNDTIRDTAFYYYENGHPSSIQIYNHGKREGCWKKFSKNGVVYIEKTFRDNSLNGPSNKYTYITGRPTEKFNFDDDLKEGKQESFYESGKPKSVCNYFRHQPCLGLREWYDSGKEVNNDFRINISEDNKVLMNNVFKIIVRLQDPRPDDKVYEIADSDTGMVVTPSISFPKTGDHFETEYYVYKGNFILKKLKIAAFRKTSMGNMMIKTASYNISVSNY